jgi:hypothetical protein
VVGLIVVAPVLLLPVLAWGGGGELDRSSYPDEWQEVAGLLADDPGPVAVLPWTGSYRGYDWNDRRAVLDPAPRYFPGEVLIDDRVLLDDEVVGAEDPRVEVVRRALAAAEPGPALRAAGVRWVLVEKGLPGVPEQGSFEGRVVHDGEDLALIDLAAGDAAASSPTGADIGSGTTVLIVIGHAGTAVCLLLGWGARIRRGRDLRHVM